MTQYGFDKNVRLLKSVEFQAVFDKVSRRYSSKGFLVLSKPNNLSYARLGMITPKKIVRLAVKRNLFKRLIRESFRLQQPTLPGLDMIVLLRKEAVDLDKSELWLNLNKLWQTIALARQ
jgi:ribonuclease P protein component